MTLTDREQEALAQAANDVAHRCDHLQSELAATRHALEVAQKAMADHDREIKAFQDRVETQREEVLKLQDDLLQGANREDQLRADNDAMSKRFMAKCLEMDKIRAELDTAKLRISVDTEVACEDDQRIGQLQERNEQLRADNEALRARLKTAVVLAHEAREMLTSAEWHFERHSIAAPKFARDLKLFREDSDTFLASGSSTGEAPTTLARCKFSHPLGGRCFDVAGHDGDHSPAPPWASKPAAPEPDPAQERDMIDELQDLLNEAGARPYINRSPKGCTCPFPRHKCPNCAEPCAECQRARPAAPASVPTFDQLVERVGPLPTTGLASAQGTTESVRVAELRGRLEAQRGKIEDLDKRVTELERGLTAALAWAEAEVSAREALDKRVTALEPCADDSWPPHSCERRNNHVGSHREGDYVWAARPATPPQPAPAESPMCYDAACRYYGQRHANPHVAPEPAPVERHAYVTGYHDCVTNGCDTMGCPCQKPTTGPLVCGQPRSAAVHGEGGK